MSRPIVIKYGGSLLEEPAHRARFLDQLVLLIAKSPVILVHGGGKDITKAVESSGLPTRFVNGRRYTDEATLSIVSKTLARITGEIVSLLKERGVTAVGTSGEQGLVRGAAVPDLGFVGIPQTVQKDRLDSFLSQSPVIVFRSVAEDASGHALNVNADDFALVLAKACRSPRLIFLTDTGAILDGDKKPIASLRASDVETLIASGVIHSGMKVKAEACLDALSKGVTEVDICKGIEFLIDPKEPFEGTRFIPS